LRYAVISDLHANLEAFEAVLEVIRGRGADQIVCLGDVVGYNANPNECVDLVRELEIPTICGNHDAVACGLEEPWGFNPIALSAALWTRDHLREDNHRWLKGLEVNRTFEHFVAAHGSPTDRDCYLFSWEDVIPHFQFLEQRERKLCFFGHTHCPGIYASDGVYTVDEESRFALNDDKAFFINPGSAGQPRDGDRRASFGLYDSDAGVYELVRVEYDVARAADKVIAAGLPSFLAERLSLGR